jgi:hypothetical protein
MANFVLDKGFHVPATGATPRFGYAVKLDTAANYQILDITATTDLVLGICQETLDAAKISTGKTVVDVRILGISRCIAGVNNITRGQKLGIDTSSRVTNVTGTVGNIVGIALTPSTTVGDQIDVLLTPGGFIAAS